VLCVEAAECELYTWVRLKVFCSFGHDVQHRSAGDVHLLQRTTSQEKHGIAASKQQELHEKVKGLTSV